MNLLLNSSRSTLMLIMGIPAIIYLIISPPYVAQIFFLIYIFIQFVWVNSLIDAFNSKLIKQRRLNSKTTSTHIIIVFLMFIAYSMFIILGFSFQSSNLAIVLLFLSLFGYTIYAVVSIFNFLSKLLVKIETEFEVEIGKRFGEFTMFLIPFIGLYWLQPRIISVLQMNDLDE